MAHWTSPKVNLPQGAVETPVSEAYAKGPDPGLLETPGRPLARAAEGRPKRVAVVLLRLGEERGAGAWNLKTY